jgi:hypothetical protein
VGALDKELGLFLVVVALPASLALRAISSSLLGEGCCVEDTGEGGAIARLMGDRMRPAGVEVTSAGDAALVKEALGAAMPTVDAASLFFDAMGTSGDARRLPALRGRLSTSLPPEIRPIPLSLLLLLLLLLI